MIIPLLVEPQSEDEENSVYCANNNRLLLQVGPQLNDNADNISIWRLKEAMNKHDTDYKATLKTTILCHIKQ